MKRVTLLDDAGGNALGWNPDGATVIFVISDPSVSNHDGIFFTIEVIDEDFITNHFCYVVNHNFVTRTFTITCSTAPPATSELHYVIGNLPSHLF